MNIFLILIYIVIGIALLYYGADWLVGSAERLARGLKISKVIVGLTIIAIGTSLPELSSSLVGALGGSPGVALGNVIGSNIANLSLVLGLTVVFKPFRVKLKELLRDGPWLILGSVLMIIMAINGSLSRLDGLVLIFFAVAFYYSVIRHVRGSRLAEKELPFQEEFHLRARDYARNIVIMIIGLAALIGGAKLLVTGALEVAHLLQLPELFIGLTVVAIGTSLPEIAVSSWSAAHGSSEIAFGNVVGSNISNIFIILGLVALISPINVDHKALNFDIPAMILITFLALLFIMTKGKISRKEGWVLLVVYFAYVVVTFFIK